VDVQSLPRPSYAKLKKEDVYVTLPDYEVGGLKYKNIQVTNKDQLNSYNANLKRAANGMKSVAARSPWIKDNSKDIKKFQIKPGTMSAVRINHLTPEMKAELKSTNYPGTGKNKKNDPTLKFEMSPAELAQVAQGK